MVKRDIYHNSKRQLTLDIFAPIVENNKVIAVIVQRNNPEKFIFPALETFDMHDLETETFLFKKTDDSLKIISPLLLSYKFPHSVSTPIKDSNSVLVRGFLKTNKLVEGYDYLGQRVIAEVDSISGTNWFIVSKVNQKLIMRDLNYEVLATSFIVLLTFLLILSSVRLIQKKKQSDLYKELFIKEKQLADSQKEFKTILYSIGDAVITTDKNSLITNMNSVAEKLTGWTEAESRGKPLNKVFNIVDEKTKKAASNPVDQVIAEGKVVGLTNHSILINSSGKEIPIANSAAPITDENNLLKGVVLVFRDQTEERTRERILFESNERYSKILNSSLDSITITKLETGEIVEANHGFEEMFGLKKELVYGKSTVELKLWADTADREAMKVLFRTNNKIRNIEAIFKRSNGEYFTGLLSGEKIAINGKTLILLFIKDINERKLYEESLRASEEKFKMLINSAPNAFVQLDKAGKFLTVNNVLSDLTGYSREELLNMNMKDLFSKEMLEISPLQYDVLQRGETLRTERTIIRKDGSGVSIEMISKQMPDGTYQSFFNDLTEQKKAQRELKDSEERFRKAFITNPDAININRLSDGKYILINNGFTSLTGHKENEVIGKTSAEINIWADINSRHKLVELLLKTNSVENFEAKFRLKDGTIKDGLMSATLIELNNELHILSITRDISDRKRAEQEIINTKLYYQKLIENAPDGIVLLSTEGLPAYISSSAKKILGYPLSQYVFPSAEELIHPDDLKNVNNVIAELTKNPDEVKAIEYRIKNFDDEYIWLEGIFTNLLFDPNINSIVVNLRDISFRKKVEEELLEKFRLEQQISRIAKTAPGGLCTFKLTPTGNISMPYVSETWMQIWDLTQEDVKDDASTLYKRIHKDDLNNLRKSIQKSAEEMTDWFFEYRINHPRKGLRWLEGHSTPTLEKDGSIIWYGFITDITERKTLLTDITESEERFRAIWENSIDAMRLIDKDGTIINANESYCRLFGLPREELIGHSFSVSYIITDDDHALLAYKERFRKRTIKNKFETEIFLKNGEKIWAEFTNSFIEPRDKEAMLLSIIRDVTDRKQLINQLTDAKTKAEEMVRLKSYFFANMSHELRTPFVGILGFAELLKNSLDNPTERQYAEQILKSSKRLTETLNKILDITKLEFDKVEINISEFDIVNTLRNVENLYSSSAKNNNTVISIVTKEDSIKMRSDARILEDIINNLVSNAVRFTKNGAINLYAEMIMTDNNLFAEIKIEDTGIGIPAEKQNLVWQEFRQVSEGFNRSFEGTGLGLTITKKYVELLSGSISLSSEENKGTTFTLTLPLILSASTPVAEKAPKKPESKLLPEKKASEKPKILYVEDDVVALQFINIVLKASYNVETAFSANEALEKITLKKYDALMLDINLGSGMDGLELMQKARENNYYKDIPIIAVTAYAAESDKTEFLTKGFNYYISKPFTQAELHKLLNEIFNNK
ncbi:MAG: PAS domain S-box protein [Ignavibacterium sp.]|nr:PAS domain S-box protein [Ignavibacterium sp.]